MVDVPIPEEGMEGIEELDACEVGIGKVNGRVTMVARGRLDGRRRISNRNYSRLVESDTIT